uniref:RNA helicase n=1 Tax=Apis cerana TaxID=7461 RepID=V9IGW4_APICE
MDYDKINFELIETILEWITFGEHNYPKTGSILIFLPGFAEIIALKDRLNDNKFLSPKTGKFIIIPLHSSLSNEEQNLVFKKSKNVRKIVLSTNLAETSITIDDCVFVIDSGKMKETRFNSNQNMESLETCWVSRANALQRKGRAGRVMSGICIHLYTSYKFKYHFTAQPVPEILRIPLEPLLLRIQLLHIGKKIDLHKILSKMLEPPTEENINSAIKRLQDVGAFNSECTLTPLGHHLATLPVNVRIGKLILFGAIFCCLDSALTIAACLSHKNPFTIPFEKRHEIDAKKNFLLLILIN